MSVILAIDLGSTSVRAFLYRPATSFEPKGVEIVVESKNRNRAPVARFAPGDFCASGYPLDGERPLYLPERPDPRRTAISLKYGFYVLADASDDLLRQYSLVNELTRRKDDVHFRARLRQGLEELFLFIKQRVDSVCRRYRLSITDISLSVPAQWTLEFEDVYRSIVADVFIHPKDNIFFHTETVALAQYLIRDHLQDLGFKDEENTHPDTILFLDFGGHNMNGCIFHIGGKDNTAARSFHLISTPFGAGGGSEQWEHNIGEIIVLLAQERQQQRLSPEVKRYILDNFHQNMLGLGPDVDGGMRFPYCDEWGQCWTMFLDSGKIREAFDLALSEPLRVAARYISEISNIKEANARVVVSGGTSQSETLQVQLKQLCAAHGLPEPIWTHTLEIYYESGKIARGAAYAAANIVSKEDYLRRGAAFGLQMLERATKGESRDNELWNDTVGFLLDWNRDMEQEVTANGRHELRIICDPFCCAPDNLTELRWRRCYNFLALGVLTQGRWRIKLTRHGSDDSVTLLFEAWRQPFKGARGRPSQFERKYSVHIPLFFDRGTNCVYTARGDGTLQALMAAQYEPAQQTTASDDDTVEALAAARCEAAQSTANGGDTLEALTAAQLSSQPTPLVGPLPGQTRDRSPAGPAQSTLDGVAYDTSGIPILSPEELKMVKVELE